MRDVKLSFAGLGLTNNKFSYHMNQVPYFWPYFNNEINMLFASGLLGIHMSENNKAFMPIFGYAVMEDRNIHVEKLSLFFL